MFRPAGALREAALWIAAAIGTLCLVAAVAAVAFGMTPLIFRSGSMSPGIPTGSLAIALSTPASELAVGDIVSVVWADGLRVTHRLVGIDPGGGLTFLLSTKGDANAAPDHERVAVTAVDRVVWSAPGLGYLFEEVTKPQWVFGLGVLVGVLLLLVFRGATSRATRGPTPRPEPAPRHARASERHPARAATVGVATIVALAIGASALVAAPTGTLAAFTDPASAATSFSATTVQPPTGAHCVVTGGVLSAKTVTLSWTAPTTGAPPTSYLVAWSGVGSPGSATVSAPATSYVITPGTLGIGIYTFTITSQFGTTPWVSSSSISQQISWVTSLLVTGC